MTSRKSSPPSMACKLTPNAVTPATGLVRPLTGQRRQKVRKGGSWKTWRPFCGIEAPRTRRPRHDPMTPDSPLEPPAPLYRLICRPALSSSQMPYTTLQIRYIICQADSTGCGGLAQRTRQFD
jgi:hypothetical protein